MAPVPLLMDRPAGKPVADHVTASLSASLAIGVTETEDPARWLCAPIADITGALLAVMVQLNVSLSLKLPSETVIVTLDVPAVLGVPEITPVELLMLRPVGKPLADQLSVSPLLASVALGDTETEPP